MIGSNEQALAQSSGVDVRSLLTPWLIPLDLAGKLKKILFAEATDKLQADWQARLRPGEWQEAGQPRFAQV